MRLFTLSGMCLAPGITVEKISDERRGIRLGRNGGERIVPLDGSLDRAMGAAGILLTGMPATTAQFGAVMKKLVGQRLMGPNHKAILVRVKTRTGQGTGAGRLDEVQRAQIFALACNNDSEALNVDALVVLREGGEARVTLDTGRELTLVNEDGYARASAFVAERPSLFRRAQAAAGRMLVAAHA